MKTSAILTLTLVFALHAPTQAQQGQRAAASIGKTLSDMAQRQIDLEQEVEIARRKAEIELDLQRKLSTMRERSTQQRQEQPTSVAAKEPSASEARLARRHPQWAEIVSSNAFGSWLDSRPGQYSVNCRQTDSGDVMIICINDFFRMATFAVK